MNEPPQAPESERLALRVIAALLFAGLNVLVISTSWPREYAAQYCHAEHVSQGDETKSGDEGRLSSAVDCVSPDAQAKSAEAYQPENHWPDFWIALGTVWLVCGTFFLGWWTYRLWAETRDALKQARTDADLNRNQAKDLFFAERRPWVTVRPQVTSPLRKTDPTSGWLEMNLVLENLGLSPAFDVAIQWHDMVRINFRRDELEAEIEKNRRDDARMKEQGIPRWEIGPAIFPGRPLPMPHVATGQIISPQLLNPARPTFFIVGWIRYRFAIGGEAHYTRFVWEVAWIPDANGDPTADRTQVFLSQEEPAPD